MLSMKRKTRVRVDNYERLSEIISIMSILRVMRGDTKSPAFESGFLLPENQLFVPISV